MRHGLADRWGALRTAAPGLLLSGTVAMAARFISEHQGGPTLLYALLIGMAFHSVVDKTAMTSGIEAASKTILRIGVALLGAQIGVSQLVTLGWPPVILVVSGVTLTITAGWLLARLCGVSRDLGILTGGAVAVCGASAALAISAALPSSNDKERDTLFTVVAVTVLSTIAMVVYPVLTSAYGLGIQESGILLGATIHDVAQVVAAGYLISDDAGLIATYTKLLRVALLLPVVVAVAFLTRGGGAGSARPVVPGFIVAFAALVIVNSLGLIAPSVSEALAGVSRWCLICAIAALGMKTSLKHLSKVGWPALILVSTETLFLLALVSAGLWLMGTRM